LALYIASSALCRSASLLVPDSELVIQGVGLNPINFRNDPCHILIERCRYLTAEVAG
jgi:hypothetical protein